jgi:hypothetical protein
LVISKLEKVKAGLGAAGMAAIAVEALGPRVLGSGVLGSIVPVIAAVASGAVAFYFTEVSVKEAALGSAAAKEGTLRNAAGQ